MSRRDNVSVVCRHATVTWLSCQFWTKTDRRTFCHRNSRITENNVEANTEKNSLQLNLSLKRKYRTTSHCDFRILYQFMWRILVVLGLNLPLRKHPLLLALQHIRIIGPFYFNRGTFRNSFLIFLDIYLCINYTKNPNPVLSGNIWQANTD